MTPSVSPATAKDLSAITALLKTCKLPLQGIEQHLDTALVARENGELVACAAVEIYGSVGLLRSVAVRPDHRGTGLGQRVTAAALELARQRGLTNVYLLTTTAGEFFPRFGFVPVARSQLDPALSQSEELRGACPASALAMRLELSTSSPPFPRSSAQPPALPG
jgi:amino-acid N-acetyltransferase